MPEPFLKLPMSVLAREDLCSTDKLLIARLLDLQEFHGVAKPGLRSLARDLGLKSWTSVLTSVRRLVSAGLVQIDRGQGRTTTRYKVCNVLLAEHKEASSVRQSAHKDSASVRQSALSVRQSEHKRAPGRTKSELIRTKSNNTFSDPATPSEKTNSHIWGRDRIQLDIENRLWLGIVQQDRETWSKAYPACDLDVELTQMISWCTANPQKGRKKNYSRFIDGWLSRQQDSGGTNNVGRGKNPNERRARKAEDEFTKVDQPPIFRISDKVGA